MLKHTLRRTVDALDRAGFRKGLATAATLAARAGGRNQRFGVDKDGNWVNEQPEATFVSPDMLFSHYPAKQREIADLWCHQYTPRAGDVVVDVGAGIGDEALVFSRMVGPTGRVIAIEAHPHTHDCLVRTIGRSGLSNVTALHCAVADVDGTVRIGDAMDAHISNSIMTNNSSGVDVPAWRLDRILADQGIRDVALLKMNIEGAERLAIRGLSERVGSVRHYAISCHDFIADRDGGNEELRTREEVLAWFRTLGLEIARRTDDPRPWVRDYVYAQQAG